MHPLAGGFQSALVISITGSSVSRCDNAQEAPTKDKGQGKKGRVAVRQRGQHRKAKVRHPLFGPFSLVKIGSVFDCDMILVGKRIALSGVSFAGRVAKNQSAAWLAKQKVQLDTFPPSHREVSLPLMAMLSVIFAPL